METILQFDKDLFLFLNNLGNSNWDNFWVFVTNKLNSIPIYLVLLFLTYRQFGIKKTLFVLVAVALMILCVDQLANFFKYGIKRLRPCFDSDVNMIMRQVLDSCLHRGQFGYFSAHAANSFAVAIFFSSILKTNRKAVVIFILIWASLVAYSRIYIGVHFPLDVFTGIFLGALFGWIFSKLLQRIFTKKYG
ncbi:phosphatase PAP2 family protein [Aurantibacter sp.]|uniref:phosphatase PAP2 family protein n=1 Tax=Aurantibacter sp. TaxID=2807103 RepID=UPI0032635776